MMDGAMTYFYRYHNAQSNGIPAMGHALLGSFAAEECANSQ